MVRVNFVFWCSEPLEWGHFKFMFAFREDHKMIQLVIVVYLVIVNSGAENHSSVCTYRNGFILCIYNICVYVCWFQNFLAACFIWPLVLLFNVFLHVLVPGEPQDVTLFRAIDNTTHTLVVSWNSPDGGAVYYTSVLLLLLNDTVHEMSNMTEYTNHTFFDLQPGQSYRASVVAANMEYIFGNHVLSNVNGTGSTEFIYLLLR